MRHRFVVQAVLVSGVIIALAVPLLSVLSFRQFITAQHGRTHHDRLIDTSTFGPALTAAMDRMHQEMMAPLPTGDADLDFLASMIPHHEGAVEMARLVLIHGKDPLVRRLAEEIIASQQSEIAAMNARLNILKNGADPNPGGFPALGGTRGLVQ